MDRELVREFAKKLVGTFEGTGMMIKPEELEKDGVATVELDKLIVRTIRKMVDKNVTAPLMKLAVAFLWDADLNPHGPADDKNWAEHTVSYRVVCTAVLLEKFRHLQRVKRDGANLSTMNEPIKAGSLFDHRSGLVDGRTTLADKMLAYRKILVARGVIPRSPNVSAAPKT